MPSAVSGHVAGGITFVRAAHWSVTFIFGMIFIHFMRSQIDFSLAATQPPSMWHLHSWSECCLKNTEKCFALITILVKVLSYQPYNAIWCQSWYVPQKGGGGGVHATCLIKNKKVARLLFVQTTGIFYPESQPGVCVWSTRHTHTCSTPAPCRDFTLGQLF